MGAADARTRREDKVRGARDSSAPSGLAMWAMFMHPALRLLPSHCWRHGTCCRAEADQNDMMHQPTFAGGATACAV